MRNETTSARRFKHWLAGLLMGPDLDRNPTRVATVKRSRAKAPGLETGISELDERLSTFLEAIDRSGEALTAGAVQLIGLSSIRDRLGAKWEKFSDRVHAITREQIEKHLSDTDVYSLYRDDSYIILFPTLSEEQAQFKVTVIGDAISTQLFGSNDQQGSVSVKALVYRVDGAMEFKDIDKEVAVQRLVTRARERLEAADGGHVAQSVEDDEASAAPPIEVVFQPMWNVKKNVVSGFVAFLQRRDPECYDKIFRATRDIDCFTLCNTIKKSYERSEHRFNKIIIIPVHLSTLSVLKNRREYIDKCKSIPDELRKYIVFELILCRDSTVSSRLDHVAGHLGPFGRSLMCRVDIDFDKFEIFENKRFLAVGMSLPSGRIDERKWMSRMDFIAGRCESNNISSYLHNIPSLSMASAAIASGFDYLSGEPIGSFVGAHLGAYRFGLEDLFSRGT